MKALLIVDMQQGSFISAPRLNADKVVEKINILSELFRQNNEPVIYVRHDGTAENCLIPGTSDWNILPTLINKPQDIFVEKTANDSFYKTNLQELLVNNTVDELVIVGCASDFCVDTTIRAALNLDYKITIIADAHTTADRPFIKAVVIINHLNWLWADMTATKYKMQVMPLNEYLKLNS
jgi:nicotinamidase-related amidase